MSQYLNEFSLFLIHNKTLIILLIALFEWFIPYPYIFRLNRLLPSLANLGRRVNKYGHTRSQQYLAGVLLPTMIFFIVGVLVLCVYTLSQSQSLLEIIILFFIFESRPPRSAFYAIRRLTNSNQNSEARSLLARFTLRRTDKLSSMGILKASTEMVILRLFYNFYMPLFISLTLGVYIALIYRIVLLLRMSFNQKLPFNHIFGTFVFSFATLFEALPTLFILGVGTLFPHKYPIKNSLTNALNYWPSKTGGLFLAQTGAAIDIKLGGPRYYLLNLFRFPIIGGTKEPDLNLSLICIKHAILVLWSGIIILATLCLLVSHLYA